MAVIFQETWTGADGSAWPAQWDTSGSNAGSTIDIQGNRGRLVTPATAGARGPRAVATSTLSQADTDRTLTYTTPATAGEAFLVLGARCSGTYATSGSFPADGYMAQIQPDATGFIRLKRGDGSSTGLNLTSQLARTWATNTTYKIRFRVVGSFIGLKVWLASGTEPTAWDLQVTDTTWTAAGKPTVDFVNGSVATAKTALLDDLVISSVPAASTVWVGAPSQTGMTVAVKATAPVTAGRLQVATDSAFTKGIAYGPMVSSDTTGALKLAITGLTPGTTYYYRPELEGALDSRTGSFRTLPAGRRFSFAFGSCSDTANSPTFAVIRAANPDFFIHLGDLHYANIATNDPTLFRAQYDAVLGSANQGRLYATVPTVYVWSDHDSGPDNHDGSDPAMPAAQLAYRERVPHYPLAATDGKGIYQTFVIGRIRFIVTDQRSYRSPDAATDNATKTMLGATQKQWFKDTITAATEQLIIWCSEVPWFSGAQAGLDDWRGFATERDELAAFFTASGKKFAILDGDVHSLAADNGTNRPAGIPTFRGAPFDMDSVVDFLTHTAGSYPLSNGIRVQQFGWMDVADNGDSIVLTFTGYDVSGLPRIRQTTTFPLASPRSYDSGWHVYDQATHQWMPVSAALV